MKVGRDSNDELIQMVMTGIDKERDDIFDQTNEQ